VFPHSIALVIRFDTFRCGGDAEAGSKFDHCLYDGGAILRIAQLADEGLVDFDFVEREKP
jgi:hypothetical protein